ncbi:hypothetical protein DFJ73DRAFT_629163 [Zopfochytrium polystomum]|nr:hypothetical protein DFJ73DRAFT_629163 [Zopfochytrium polystomum]
MTTADLLAHRITMLDRSEELVELARRRISEARVRRAEQFNREHRMRPSTEAIEEGDLVIVRDSKLDNVIGGKLSWRYFGPFWVTEVGPNAYYLAEMDGSVLRRPIQGSRVKLYRKRDGDPDVLPEVVLEDGEDEENADGNDTIDQANQ